MELKRAIEIVVADQRESFPEMSVGEAIDHAMNVVNPDTLYDYGDDNYHAYTTVFAADESELDHIKSVVAYVELLRSKSPTELLDDLQRIVLQASGKPSYDSEAENEMVQLIRAEILTRVQQEELDTPSETWLHNNPG